MLRLFIILLTSFNPVLSSINISTKFKSTEQAIKTLTTPSFFRHRMLYLDTNNYYTSQNLIDSNQKIKWPLEIIYNKKHSLKKFPLLPVPSLKTKEIWSLDSNQLTGHITTPLITMKVIIKAKEKDVIIVNINSLIISKSVIVPFKNKVIQDDVCFQIKNILSKVLHDSGF